jgi:hypothetical protein
LPDQSALPPAWAATAAVRVWEVSDQGEDLLVMLFPHLAGLRVHRVEDAGGRGGDLGVVPGGVGVLPAVRAGVFAGARRVLAGGG